MHRAHGGSRVAGRGHEAHHAPVGQSGHDHLRQLRERRVDVHAGRQRSADLVEEGELLLVTLGRVGQASTVERQSALGRNVLEQVPVRLPRGCAPGVVEPHAHRPERAAERILQRKDDEGRIDGEAQAVEVGVALAAVGGRRHGHRLTGADHLGRRQPGRQRDATEPLGQRLGRHAGGPRQHQLVARLGEDVQRRRAPAQELDAVLEHGVDDLGGTAGAVEPLDQAGEPGVGGRGRGRAPVTRPGARVGDHRRSRPRRGAVYVGCHGKPKSRTPVVAPHRWCRCARFQVG